MKVLANTCATVIGLIAKNPSGTAGMAVFGLGFALIASNAIYAQNSTHPDPIYTTHEQQQVEQSIVRPLQVTKAPVSITNSVLTQRFSVKNIPVPTANPARGTSVSVHSSLVRDVQSTLASVGLYDGKVDGIYGSQTRQSIITYQQNAGILPDGEASYGLLTNLKSAHAVAKLHQSSQTRNVVQTSTVPSEYKAVKQPQLLVFDTDTVARIQTGLRENFGDDSISVDGLLGKQTRSAIRRFQERFKLDATGELNEETVQKLVSSGIVSSI